MSETTIKTPAGRTYEVGSDLIVDTLNVFDVTISQYVPSTVDSYERATGRPGSAVEHAVAYTIARSGASRYRALAIKAMESLGMKPNDGEKADAFIKRCRSEKGEKEVNALIAATLADRSLYLIALENSKERGGDGITKEVRQLAADTRERWAAGESSPTSTAAKFAEKGVEWANPTEDIADDEFYILIAAYLKALRRPAL